MLSAQFGRVEDQPEKNSQDEQAPDHPMRTGKEAQILSVGVS